MTSDPWAPEPDPQAVDPAWLNSLHSTTSRESAEPDAPPLQPLLQPDEWMAIRDEIKERKWDDHALIPELLTEALRVLGEIGTGNTPDPGHTATQALRAMVYRAHTGVPFGEIEEPAWSLDSARSFR